MVMGVLYHLKMELLKLPYLVRIIHLMKQHKQLIIGLLI